MRIVEYTIDDLKELLTDEEFWKREVLPISKHRLISHINNPRALGTDLALIVSFNNKDDDNSIIGYLGILPDKIFIKKDKEEKFAWMSCWWVDPKMNNRGIGSKLLQRAVNFYKDNIGGFHPSDMAIKALIENGKYSFIEEPQGITVIFNSNTNYLLKRKIPFLKRVTFLLSIFDTSFNFIKSLLYLVSRRKIIKTNLNIEYINSIDNQTEMFIKKHHETSTKLELFKRESKELNWIIKYPWILSVPLKDDIIKDRYHFSSLSHLFKLFNIKIYNSRKEIIGFVILKIRDNELTIPYSYFHTKNSKIINNVIIKHIIELNIDMAYFTNQSLIDEFKKLKYPILYKWKNTRTRYISSKFKKIDMNYYKVQDGDADAVFF